MIQSPPAASQPAPTRRPTDPSPFPASLFALPLEVQA